MEESEVELGQEVQDQISGFRGIVMTYGEHLTGCTRIGVRPVGEEDTAHRGEEEFFYPDQLELIDGETRWTDRKVVEEVDFELGEQVRDDPTNFEGFAAVINYKLFNCPSVAIQPVDKSDVTERGELEWFDAPRVERTGDGIREDYHTITENDETAETGAVADKRPQNLKG